MAYSSSISSPRPGRSDSSDQAITPISSGTITQNRGTASGAIVTEQMVGGFVIKPVSQPLNSRAVIEDSSRSEPEQICDQRRTQLREAACASYTALTNTHEEWLETVGGVQAYATTGVSTTSMMDIRRALDQAQDSFVKEANKDVKAHMLTVLRAVPFQPWLQSLCELETFIPEQLEKLNHISLKKLPTVETSEQQTNIRANKGLTRLKELSKGGKCLAQTRNTIESAIAALSEPGAAKATVSEYQSKFVEELTTLAQAAGIDTSPKSSSPEVKTWEEIDALVLRMAETSLEADNSLPPLPPVENFRSWLIQNIILLYGNYFKAFLLCHCADLHELLKSTPSGFNDVLSQLMGKVESFNKALAMLKQNPLKTEDELSKSPLKDIVGVIQHSEVARMNPDDRGQMEFNLQRLYPRANPPKQIEEAVVFQFQDYLPAVKSSLFSRLWYKDESAMKRAANAPTAMLTSSETSQPQGFFAKLKRVVKRQSRQNQSQALVSTDDFRTAFGSMKAHISSDGLAITLSGDKKTKVPIPRFKLQSSSASQAKQIVTDALTMDESQFTIRWGDSAEKTTVQTRTESRPLGTVGFGKNTPSTYACRLAQYSAPSEPTADSQQEMRGHHRH